MMQQLTDPPAEKERTDQPVQQCDHTGIGIGTLQLVTEILQVVGRIALLAGTQRAAAEKTDVHHVNAKRTGRCQTFSDRRLLQQPFPLCFHILSMNRTHASMWKKGTM